MLSRRRRRITHTGMAWHGMVWQGRDEAKKKGGGINRFVRAIHSEEYTSCRSKEVTNEGSIPNNNTTKQQQTTTTIVVVVAAKSRNRNERDKTTKVNNQQPPPQTTRGHKQKYILAASSFNHHHYYYYYYCRITKEIDDEEEEAAAGTAIRAEEKQDRDWRYIGNKHDDDLPRRRIYTILDYEVAYTVLYCTAFSMHTLCPVLYPVSSRIIGSSSSRSSRTVVQHGKRKKREREERERERRECGHNEQRAKAKASGKREKGVAPSFMHACEE